MIFGNGIDIIEIHRIKSIIDKHPRFLDKYFTDGERQYFETKKYYWESVAGYFAAKEATSKALGTGIKDIEFKDIEICKNAFNRPSVIFHNKGKEFIRRHHIDDVFVSISHCKEYAVANAIATTLCKG
ncbi:MAG: holo-ACP synthase [Eubacteriales bacterium]